MSVKLVAGLGNPGSEYAATRHNLGFILLDHLVSRQRLQWERNRKFDAETARWDRSAGETIILVKPQSYMNDSGRPLQSLSSFYKVPPTDLIVAYDDLAMKVGSVKVSVKGSSGGHNGVQSILGHIGDGFIRYRLGIGPKEPAEMDMKDYVLGKFTNEQQTLLINKLDTLLAGLLLILDQGVDRAMNQLNRKDQNDRH